MEKILTEKEIKKAEKTFFSLMNKNVAFVKALFDCTLKKQLIFLDEKYPYIQLVQLSNGESSPTLNVFFEEKEVRFCVGYYGNIQNKKTKPEYFDKHQHFKNFIDYFQKEKSAIVWSKAYLKYS